MTMGLVGLDSAHASVALSHHVPELTAMTSQQNSR
jgi:hypothetical protein